MVKFTATTFAALALLSGTALAQSADDAEYLAAREPVRFGLAAAGRFVSRHGGARMHAPQVDVQQQQQQPPQDGNPQRRELSDDLELFAREPVRFGGLASGARRFLSNKGHSHERHEHMHVPQVDQQQQQQQPPQDGNPQRREFTEDYELFVREPVRFGGLASGARRFLSNKGHSHERHEHMHVPQVDQQQQQQQPPQDGNPQRREFTEDYELLAREPVRFGGLASGARRFLSNKGHSHERHEHMHVPQVDQQQQQQQPPQDGNPQRREFTEDYELLAREPVRFGGLASGARRFLSNKGHSHERHEHMHVPQVDQQQQQQQPPQDGNPQRREFDEDFELLAREPVRFGGLASGARRFLSNKGHSHERHEHMHVPQVDQQQQQQQPPQDGNPQRREFSELSAREPVRFGGLASGARRFLSNKGHSHERHEHMHVPQVDQQQQQQQPPQDGNPQRREFEDMDDLLEREFEDFDDLD